MEDTCCVSRRWDDMDIDILFKIFQNLNIFELTSGVGHVCRTWRMAACDPLLWKTLDMSLLKSNFIKIPLEPYVYVDGRSDKTFTRVLKISLNLSRGNVSTLIFHYNMYVSDDQLAYTADRCPRLKRLVMPAWNRIKKTGICRAVRIWQDLESLTMPSISNPVPRGGNFPKLQEILRDALIIILEGLKGLEVLNISHCLVVEVPPHPAPRRVLIELDKSILERASRLKTFLTCMSDSCIMCQRTRNDEGLIRWYKYEEDLWKVDEVSSLAV
ncbi:hypothetical protein DH2020_048657 [Rehmannia glutinosa]|uniref:F-box domain-containing protein n=1 Tax=Rehmannia glutinosa TaxID=99300 RepID=A0ABR0U677_REHGL